MSNTIMSMIRDVDIVYVDGLTIKDRRGRETHSNVAEVFKNLSKYHVTAFNRNSEWGLRFLVLTTEYKR
jgi:hypothetical protein